MTVNAGAQVWFWIRTDGTVNTIANDFAPNGGRCTTKTACIRWRHGHGHGRQYPWAKWTNKPLTVSGQITGGGRLFVNRVNGAGDGGSRVVLTELTNNYGGGTEHLAGVLSVPGMERRARTIWR